MESAVVTVRVPVAKKENAARILKKLGATQSEFINLAFDQLLDTKQLPRIKPKAKDIDEFKAILEETTIDIDWSKYPQNMSYKEMLREWKAADYESLT
ncbi:MAG: hypothetical protein MJ189_03900 [Coriobacteriales bacterium]|nr:hypothetical protein [Coriobacteriales bacterium]